MTDADRRLDAWLLALLFAVVASPACFVLGGAAATALLTWLDRPTSAEGFTGIAFAAFFVGAPLGVVVGGALIAGLAVWWGPRWGWRTAVAVLLGLAAASGWALMQIDTL